MLSRRVVAAVGAAALFAGLVPAAARAADPAARPDPVAAPGLAGALSAVGSGSLLVAIQGVDADAPLDAAQAAGMRIHDHWPEVEAVIAEGSAAQVRDVLDADGVTYVEPDQQIELLLDTAHYATRAEDARQPASGLLRPDDLPYTGDGVSIAVIDSGIDATHPMFNEGGTTKVRRNLRTACPLGVCSAYVQVDDSDTLAAGGHGTHVSGIAAGFERTAGDGRVVRGAAPGADLIVLGHGGGLSIFNSTGGLRWVLQNHADPCGDGSCPPIRVVNNSWGSGPDSHDPNSIQSKVVNDLVAAGVTVVFAVANEGGDGTENRMSPQSQNPTPGVLGVANYHDDDNGNRDGSLDSSSSRAKQGLVETYPDISAVGSAVLSACRPHLSHCYLHASLGDPNREYYVIGGTSMAAPYVAGVVALMLEADPTLTPAQIEDILEDSAYKFGDPASYEADVHNTGGFTSFDKGHGLVDVAATLATVLNRPEPPVAGECLPAAAVSFADPANDDTRFGVEVGVGQLHTEALDIRQVEYRWDEAADQLVVTVTVTDLADSPPSGSAGELFYAFFLADGERWYATATDNRATGTAGRLGNDGASRTSFADIAVAFDRSADTATLRIPRAASGGGFSFSLDDGDVLSGFEVESRRTAGVLAPVADVANDACPVLVSRS